MRARHEIRSGKSRIARAALFQWLAERAPQTECLMKTSGVAGGVLDTSKIKECERDMLWKWIQRHAPRTRALLKSEAFRSLRDELTRVFRESVEPAKQDAFGVAVGLPSATVYRVARLEQRRAMLAAQPAPTHEGRGAFWHPASATRLSP